MRAIISLLAGWIIFAIVVFLLNAALAYVYEFRSELALSLTRATIFLLAAALAGYVAAAIGVGTEMRYVFALGLLLAIPQLLLRLAPPFESLAPEWLSTWQLGYAPMWTYIAPAAVLLGALIGGALRVLRLDVLPSALLLRDWWTGVPDGHVPRDYGHRQDSFEADRLLAGSTLALGTFFRWRILDFVNQPYQAFAPELGISLHRLNALSSFFERRESGFRFGMVLVSGVGLIASVTLVSIQPLLACVTVLWLLRLWKYSADHQLIRRHFQSSVYDPERVAERFRLSAPTKPGDLLPETGDQAVTVYGGYNPFVGLGFPLTSWSLSVNTKKPGETTNADAETQEFSDGELSEHLEQALADLAGFDLRFSDFVPVSGTDLDDRKWLLPSRVAAPLFVSPGNLPLAENRPNTRSYKWMHISDWAGELIISYLVNLTRWGDTLHVEVRPHVLGPIDEEHRRIDGIGRHNILTLTAVGIGELIALPFGTFLAWIIGVWSVLRWLADVLRLQERLIRMRLNLGLAHNYGAHETIREAMSAPRFTSMLQVTDRDRYTKVLDGRILDAIVDFLEAHGVDTQDVKARGSFIINSGVIGEVRTDILAVGSGAKATKSGGPKWRRKSRNPADI